MIPLHSEPGQIAFTVVIAALAIQGSRANCGKLGFPLAGLSEQGSAMDKLKAEAPRGAAPPRRPGVVDQCRTGENQGRGPGLSEVRQAVALRKQFCFLMVVWNLFQ